MAILKIQLPGFAKSIELRPGKHRLGRAPDNDFVFEHITVSSYHCEITVSHDALLVQDLNSTNGTYIAGERVSRAPLLAGQALRLGEFEMSCESVLPRVSVPSLTPHNPTPAIDLGDGVIPCFTHPDQPASDRCIACQRCFCPACVHSVRMVGGAAHRLCPMCSRPVEPLTSAPAPKKNFLLGALQKTLRIFGSRSAPKRKRRRR